MQVFHSTSRESALSILRAGFRDAESLYLTSQLWSGVWLSDVPLDPNEGCKGGVVLTLTIPAAVFEEHEWVEDEGALPCKRYREALVPAETVNGFGPPVLAPEKCLDSCIGCPLLAAGLCEGAC